MLDLDIAVEMGEAVKIDGFGLSGTLGGSLRVREAPGRDMRATGALDVAGRYRAYGQNLQITRGRPLWSNSEIGDPRGRARRARGRRRHRRHPRRRQRPRRARLVYSIRPRANRRPGLDLTLGRPLSTVTGAEARQLGRRSRR